MHAWTKVWTALVAIVSALSFAGCGDMMPAPGGGQAPAGTIQVKTKGLGVLNVPADIDKWTTYPCKSGSCDIGLTFSSVDLVPAGSKQELDCHIAIGAVLIQATGSPADTIVWKLANGGMDGNYKFQFNPTLAKLGIFVRNNKDLGGGLDVYEVVLSGQNLVATGTVKNKAIKVFTYDVNLQWKDKAAEKWNDCLPLDPLIANRE
jgi:hypothetical protein